jgi:DEAD/DEAH box helicase domain-containing protein
VARAGAWGIRRWLRRAGSGDRNRGRRIPRCDSHPSNQRWRALGYEIRTDVFELQLDGLDSVEVALPLGAAIRDALATKLGVEAGEMGVSASHTSDENGVRRWSILIFDKAPGGAGFSVAASDRIDDLLKAAAEILDCPRKTACLLGCPECIMCRDIESLEEKIDRIGALSVARRVLARLALPAKMAVLGSRTRFEFRPLADAVVREMRARPNSALRIWLTRMLESSDLSKWPLLMAAQRLASRGHTVQW